MKEYTLFWFRRDLRLEDNHGLYKALQGKSKVIPIFIFDPSILNKLPKEDARVEFILLALGALDIAMKRNRCNVGIYHGTPKAIFNQITNNWKINKVICNEDYEPYAIKRDKEIKKLLNQKGIHFEMYKDQVIFEKNEIVKNDGTPYKVYTPYSKKWLSQFQSKTIKNFPSEKLLNNLYNESKLKSCSLEELGFKKSKISQPELVLNNQIIDNYEETRNFPFLDKTSK